jgi:hypothetical protein
MLDGVSLQPTNAFRTDRDATQISVFHGARKSGPECESGKEADKFAELLSTGLPALSVGPDAPTLSSKEVEEIVANFP